MDQTNSEFQAMMQLKLDSLDDVKTKLNLFVTEVDADLLNVYALTQINEQIEVINSSIALCEEAIYQAKSEMTTNYNNLM